MLASRPGTDDDDLAGPLDVRRPAALRPLRLLGLPSSAAGATADLRPPFLELDSFHCLSSM
jgi:hypothetical protein